MCKSVFLRAYACECVRVYEYEYKYKYKYKYVFMSVTTCVRLCTPQEIIII